MANVKMTNEEQAEWDAYQFLSMYAHDLLGASQWRLLKYYGKVMDGSAYSGLYVSGLPHDVAMSIVDNLTAGRIVEVHLMHRHKSGVYEASSLCRQAGRLIMLFDDRSEFA